MNFFKKKKTIIKEEVNIEKKEEENNKDIDESDAELIIQEPIRSINTSDIETPYYSETSSLPITPTNGPMTPPNTPILVPISEEKIMDLKTKIEDLNEKNQKLNNKVNNLEFYYNKELEYLKYGSIFAVSVLSYYLLSKKSN
jgi:hypothetical protein